METSFRRTLEREVEALMSSDSSGHDFFHVLRVVRNAERIMKDMDVDRDLVLIASYLHDVDDDKIFNTIDYGNARRIMSDLSLDSDVAEEVVGIISSVSFSSGRKAGSREAQIVQDADRLDALGAIGIARTFLYSGSHGNLMYDPDIKPRYGMDKSEYRSDRGTGINHFYEKLLLLEDLMNTEEARRLAHDRTIFMKEYLEQFLLEWEGRL